MKRSIKTVIKATAVVAYGIVFAEFFIRVFDPQPLLPRYVTGGDDGIRRNMESESYWQTTPEVRVQMRTNSQGIRADRVFPFVTEDGVCRIALFGDSFMFGYEADIEDIFASRLERNLEKAGYSVEVINFAVSGFGSGENLVALQRRGLQFNPDIVLFEWHSTDIDDDARAKLFKVEGERLVRHEQTFLPAIETSDFLMRSTIYRWLIENSQSYSLVRERAAAFIKALLVDLGGFKDFRADDPVKDSSTVAESPPDAPAGPKTVTRGPELNLAILREAKAISEEAGAFFMLVDVPIRRSRIEYESSSTLLPKAGLSEFVIADPIEVFRANTTPESKIYFEQGHYHLTPTGNQLLADVVGEKLLQQPGVLQKCVD